MTAQEIKTALERSVVESLEQGQEDQALALLDRILKQEPANKVANAWMRQVRDDPLAIYGRSSFEYRVQPGETLSRIAGRFLGDIYQFYGLARYNGIKVPRQLSDGQSIRVPGKAPVAGNAQPPAAGVQLVSIAPTPPAPAPAALRAGYYASDPEADALRANQERKASIARLSGLARAAQAKKDFAAAVGAWNRVLGMDPTNSAAKLERSRAIEMNERAARP